MTDEVNQMSVASAGSHGIPVVVPALTLAGNFAGVKWNSCCRQHRAVLDGAGIEWVEDMSPLALPLEVTPDELAARCEAYRIALADAIRRPMGVIPESAEGLVTQEDIDAAEKRRTK